MNVISTVGDFMSMGKKLTNHSDKFPRTQSFIKNVVMKIVNMGICILMTVGAVKYAIESLVSDSKKKDYKTGRYVSAAA